MSDYKKSPELTIVELVEKIKKNIESLETEIQKQSLIKGDIITSNDTEFDGDMFVVSSIYQSRAFEKLQHNFSFFILPLKNRMLKTVKSFLPKDIRANGRAEIVKEFQVNYFSIKPLFTSSFLYKVYNEYNVPKNIENFIRKKFNLEEGSVEVVCKFFFEKGEKGYIKKIMVKQGILNRKVPDKQFKQIIKDKELYSYMVRKNKEILKHWIDINMQLIKDVVKKARGIVTLKFYCQKEEVMIWSLMIDGHFKVKMTKPVAYKLSFPNFKKNYAEYITEFLSEKPPYSKRYYELAEKMRKTFVSEFNSITLRYCGKKYIIENTQKQNKGFLKGLLNFLGEIYSNQH